MGGVIQQTARDLRRSYWFLIQGACCYLRIAGKCQMANGAMTFDRGRDSRFATWEHLNPSAAGGVALDNLLLACTECNNLKANYLIATPADLALAKAICEAWRTQIQFAMVPQLSGAPSIAAEPWPLIDTSCLRSKENRAERFERMRAVGMSLGDGSAWVKNAHGEKVVFAAPQKPAPPKPKVKPAQPVAPKIPIPTPNADRHPRIPAVGYDEPLSVRVKRTAELDADLAARGIPVRAARNAESQAAAALGISERAARQGNKQLANSLADKARALLDRISGNNRNNPSGRAT